MKNEKGVTIVALAITVVVMTIITFTVFYTAEGIETTTDDDILIAELETIHHIVLQEYNKKITLGNEYNYKGSKVEDLSIYNTNLGFELTSNNYYELTPDILKSIGAKNVSSSYLVCYETGEVVNTSYYKTSDGKLLYTK